MTYQHPVEKAQTHLASLIEKAQGTAVSDTQSKAVHAILIQFYRDLKNK